MAESSNHQLGSKRTHYGCEQDKISSLPDELLIHILSLLPTKFSVMTSVLSSRWKCLWASVPTIDFHDRVYIPKIVKNFIDNILFYHKLPSIQRLRLRVGKIDVPQLNLWIEAVVRRGGIHEIDIVMDVYNSQRLSSHLFTCKTLVELKLPRSEVDIPATVYFPFLKIFHIFFRFPSNEVTKKLFCSCPVLEQLYISGVLDIEERVLNVSSPVLRTLEVHLCSNGPVNGEHKYMIDAPILENISIYMPSRVCCFLKAMPLIKSKISGTGQDHGNNVLMLLKDIAYIKHLHLCSYTMGAFNSLRPDDLPVFANLKILELNLSCNTDCRILPVMLHSMPNLATLILSKSGLSHYTSSRRRIYWIEPQCVPTCLRSCLVEVIVKGIRGWAVELRLIKYFLKITENLSRVTLMHEMYDPVKIDKFRKKLANLPRRSKNCLVELGRSNEKPLLKV